jgi:hypothetical protein
MFVAKRALGGIIKDQVAKPLVLERVKEPLCMEVERMSFIWGLAEVELHFG